MANSKPIDGSTVPIPEEKPMTCHERRHLTPSQFMTYDAMRACCGNNRDAQGNRICFAQLTTLSNLTGLSVNQNRDNVRALTEAGWVLADQTPDEQNRWKGKWSNNRYVVFDHDGRQRHLILTGQPAACPPFPYSKDGVKQATMTDEQRRAFERTHFAINAALRRYANTPARKALTAALSEVLRNMTTEEREAWVRQLKGEE